MSTVDSVGKPPSSGQVGEVLLLLLEVLAVVIQWGEANLGIRLGLTPAETKTETEQHQKLHCDYLGCLCVTVLCWE